VNTVLQARPRNFVSTPTLERTTLRALRYLQSGYSIHLKGPAGTGKTTLALHLADLLARPIMLLFGDDEFKTSDLIGNQSGYTRKKVVDNYIHSVVKVEDELRQNWIDSRLTLACREGFTMVYDEFNRSRPEVNNVLLSALEEKLLVLPPSNNRAEYIRVSPHFRAILTSNPEEYCGVHGTQDALQDRLITINMPEPDELAQQQILVQKVGIDGPAALQIVQLVKAFQASAAPDMVSSLRPSLMIATICHDHGILPLAESADFRDVCSDILLARSKEAAPEATRQLWNLFNRFVVSQAELVNELTLKSDPRPQARLHGEEADENPIQPLEDVGSTRLDSRDESLETAPPEDLVSHGEAPVPPPLAEVVESLETVLAEDHGIHDQPADQPAVEPSTAEAESLQPEAVAPAIADLHNVSEPSSLTASPSDDIETRIFDYLDATGTASLTTIEHALGLNRFQVVNTLKSMLEQGLLSKRETDGQPTGYQICTD
jgi:gas vesicle protein GvpN